MRKPRKPSWSTRELNGPRRRWLVKGSRFLRRSATPSWEPRMGATGANDGVRHETIPTRPSGVELPSRTTTDILDAVVGIYGSEG